MSAVYLDQLTFCKVNSLLRHEAYHDAAIIDPDEPGGVSEGQLGAVPVLVVGGQPVGEATAELQSDAGAAHASWAAVKM